MLLFGGIALLKNFHPEPARRSKVELPHVWALSALPEHHNDPFDRILIAQTNTEKGMLVTKDSIIPKYPVSIFW